MCRLLIQCLKWNANAIFRGLDVGLVLRCQGEPFLNRPTPR